MEKSIYFSISTLCDIKKDRFSNTVCFSSHFFKKVEQRKEVSDGNYGTFNVGLIIIITAFQNVLCYKIT